ncbi:hypothetical protein BB559_001662 [Furculomyces boomerangus]|uniref:Matrin-type domain-containing protein n=2 Tax=Harpellales TaxID=61421 RepID=A0A2T9Z171_9FUNG|nr:hypothetical protein BB559_001662 [Furculomyces boomerangus]PWA00498.1 hypothetical protein BB558_003458 [Smittium angustum]
MDSIIERQRQIHEEIERVEQAAVQLKMLKLTTHRHQLAREHVLSELVDRIQAKSKDLLEMYKDHSGLRSKEIEKIGQGDGLTEFYSQLGMISNYYRLNPGKIAESQELEFLKYAKAPETKEEREARFKRLRKKWNKEKFDEASLTFGHSKLEKEILAKKAIVSRVQNSADQNNDDLDDEEEPDYFISKTEEETLSSQFSGEEGLGKFVDLIKLHEQYLNLKGTEHYSYLKYIETFTNFNEINFKTKKLPAYQKYLEDLCEYLEGFIKRSSPLTDVKEIENRAVVTQINFGLDKTKNDSKKNDEKNGIYCDACDKYFEKQTTFNGHLQGKKHLKSVETLKEMKKISSDVSNINLSEIKDKNIMTVVANAQLEAKIVSFAKFLEKVIADTCANVERKQSLTEEERNQEIGVEEVEVEESEEDEQEHIYNPLKLPLGWDGKPIPYWLYKLHGLSVEYKCEICGNFIYRGRKAFDVHFQEARHSNNMRRLGIPNSRQFHDIHKIEDAMALWQKVKGEKQLNNRMLDTLEEFEDNEGNVFNRKTYEDLKRQGLL